MVRAPRRVARRHRHRRLGGDRTEGVQPTRCDPHDDQRPPSRRQETLPPLDPSPPSVHRLGTAARPRRPCVRSVRAPGGTGAPRQVSSCLPADLSQDSCHGKVAFGNFIKTHQGGRVFAVSFRLQQFLQCPRIRERAQRMPFVFKVKRPHNHCRCWLLHHSHRVAPSTWPGRSLGRRTARLHSQNCASFWDRWPAAARRSPRLTILISGQEL